MEPVIAIDSVSKRYGNLLAVDSLSFEVAPGQIVAFLGPNGAGKTTTLRVLLGLAAPSSGTATINGVRYDKLDSPAETVGTVLDSRQFHPARTGRDHLRVMATAAGLGDQRVDEVLENVDLAGAAHRKVKEYSLGMRQRLAIAFALLGRPRALVLDEPSNGLDPGGHRWLRDLLKDQRDEGAAILISSHLITEVQQVLDEVVIINQGKVVAQGPVNHLTDAQTNIVEVRCGDPDRLIQVLTEHGIDAEQTPAGVVVRDVAAEKVGQIAAHEGIAVYQMNTVRQTLEDVFLELTSTERGRP
jgi:ABC-2 type transport system ATP-binding protein